MLNNQQQIKLLARCHYVLVPLNFVLFPLLGIVILKGQVPTQGAPPSGAFLETSMLVFLATFFYALVLSVCMISAGWKMSHFKNWTFCLVIGVVECSLLPLGTILGILTIIVLMRDSVIELFEKSVYNVSTYKKRKRVKPEENEPQRETNQPHQAQNVGQPEVMPTTYLWQSILITVLCCQPLGIIAIVYALLTQNYVEDGNYIKAYHASRKARMWCLIAFFVVYGILVVQGITTLISETDL